MSENNGKSKKRRNKSEGTIRERKDGRWEVIISVGVDYTTGKQKRKSFYAKTRSEAVRIAQKEGYKAAFKGNINPTNILLGEWLDIWLTTYMKNKLKRSTYINYEGYTNNHFNILGRVKLKDLNARKLQEFYNHKYEEENLSPKTLRNINNFLHAALDQAIMEGYLESNTASAISLPKSIKKEIAVLSQDEQNRLILESYKHRYGVFVRLVLCTGLRIGELLALQWEDIDISNSTISVSRTLNRLKSYDSKSKCKTEIVIDSPKTCNSFRSIPLLDKAIQDLLQWKKVQEKDKELNPAAYLDLGMLVTNENGKYVEQKTFKKYYERMLKAANLKHFTFHALRHTFSTRALERGMDAKTLSKILGHSSVSFTLDTYTHVLEDHKREEIQRMDELYLTNTPESTSVSKYPVIFSKLEDGYSALVLDFINFGVLHYQTLDEGILAIKEMLQRELSSLFQAPIPTSIADIILGENDILLSL